MPIRFHRHIACGTQRHNQSQRSAGSKVNAYRVRCMLVTFDSWPRCAHLVEWVFEAVDGVYVVRRRLHAVGERGVVAQDNRLQQMERLRRRQLRQHLRRVFGRRDVIALRMSASRLDGVFLAEPADGECAARQLSLVRGCESCSRGGGAAGVVYHAAAGDQYARFKSLTSV